MIEARKRAEDKMRKELEEKRAKEKEKKKKPTKPIKIVKPTEIVVPIKEKIIDNITMSIEDEYNKLNGIIKKENPRTNLNEPPIWDSEDICCECGKPDNSFREYSDYKLEKYEVSLCDCEESDEE